MVYKHDDTERIISELKELADKPKNVIKDKILELAKHYEKGINENNPLIISKIKSVKAKSKKYNDDASVKDIAALINHVRETNFDMVSYSWLYKLLPDKYKHKESHENEDFISPDDISTKNLYMIKDELIRKIKDMDRGPAQDIKVKETKEDIDRYNFECFIAGELAKLAFTMEKDHNEKPDSKLCSKVSKHVKSARDGRFATPQMAYEAMIVACNSTTSLANVVEGEWGFKTRWEIEEDEKNCRECRDPVECKATKCNHVCHKVVKPMTTKGLKFAINTNETLKALDDQMKKMMNDDWSDLCPFAKILLKNPKIDRYVKNASKKRIIAAHIDKDDCTQCQFFLEDHPNFFNTDKS